jgi:hypothetical protein
MLPCRCGLVNVDLAAEQVQGHVKELLDHLATEAAVHGVHMEQGDEAATHLR